MLLRASLSRKAIIFDSSEGRELEDGLMSLTAIVIARVSVAEAPEL